MTAVVRKLGWKKDEPPKPGQKPYRAAADRFGAVVPPSTFSLEQHCLEMWDQGALGSCLPHAVCVGLLVAARAAGDALAALASFLFVYWVSRGVDHTLPDDAGTTYRSATDAMSRVGACREATWPYSDQSLGADAPFRLMPSAEAWREAADAATEIVTHEITETGDLMELRIRQAIASGFPVGIGLVVDQSFVDGYPSGVAVPPTNAMQAVGGHALLVVGYEQNADGSYRYRVKNWWAGWGDPGSFFWASAAFVTDSDSVLIFEKAPASLDQSAATEAA